MPIHSRAMVALSPAAQANLERILSAERTVSAWRLAWVRLTISVVATLVVTVIAPGDSHLMAPSRWAAGIFLIMSIGALVGLRFAPSWGKWAGYLVPFIDLPVLAFAQYFQRQRLPEDWFGLPSGISLMLGLMVISSLSLSRPIIWLTTLGATASMLVAMVHASQLPLVPIAMTTSVTVLVGFVLSTVAQRVRWLVHASRSRDLMGKYVLGERLGSGGMAEVYLATYSPEGGFERVVAVKRILASYAANPESLALFRREAEVGALLAHPNVVQVLDFGIFEDSYFLAMEYIDGLTLNRLLAWCRQSGTQVPLPAAMVVAHSLAEACAYMHSRTTPTGEPMHLVHRDLNPPNVLVSRIGEVKLGDFGIARAAGQATLTQAGVMRGKLAYAAPEQALGLELDQRADLFSLGLTLHELLTGTRVLAGDSDLQVMKALTEAVIAPPSQLRPEVPPALDAIVLRLLEKERDLRTGSGGELADELASLPASVFDLALGRKQLAEWVVKAQQASGANAMEETPMSTKTALNPIR